MTNVWKCLINLCSFSYLCYLLHKKLGLILLAANAPLGDANKPRVKGRLHIFPIQVTKRFVFYTHVYLLCLLLRMKHRKLTEIIEVDTTRMQTHKPIILNS